MDKIWREGKGKGLQWGQRRGGGAGTGDSAIKAALLAAKQGADTITTGMMD